MKIHTIDTELFKLDGGAMFGVVPKSMWSKLNPPDNNNMCTWAMRCLLIEDSNRLILIDTGIGDKQDEKFKSHFYIHGENTLLRSLNKLGYNNLDITDVILTHLHFDHCGGVIKYDINRNPILQFPNAKHWLHSKQLDWALNPNDREKASFLKENIMPLVESKKIHFVDKESFGNQNINFEIAFGHTESMIIPIINYKGKKIYYCADLLPSRYHIPMPYVMSYDIRPLETLIEKNRILTEIYNSNSFIFFEHDPSLELCTLKRNEKNNLILDKEYILTDIA